MNENVFRILLAFILFTAIGISSYFRRKADQESGEKISRNVDGTAFATIVKIGGLILWLSPLIYLLSPAWMAWSMPAPTGATASPRPATTSPTGPGSRPSRHNK